MKKKLAILASGGGSNADNIMRHFENSSDVEIVLLACNKPGAGAFDVAAKWDVPSMSIDKTNFKESDSFLNILKELHVDYIILAGFLWKVPENLVKAFDGRIINIHPALLPKYGGKGMYGHFVHEAVFAAKEKESGITIHSFGFWLLAIRLFVEVPELAEGSAFPFSHFPISPFSHFPIFPFPHFPSMGITAFVGYLFGVNV